MADRNGIAGLRLVVDVGGAPSLQAGWQQGPGGTSSIVANGVLYIADENAKLTAFGLPAIVNCRASTTTVQVAP